MVGAEEALAIGLANVVVPAAELDATVTDLVAALTAPLPGAVRETKAFLLAASDRTLDEQRRPSARRRYAGSASSPRCSRAEAQSRIPRLAISTERARPWRKIRSTRSLADSSHSTSDVCQAPGPREVDAERGEPVVHAAAQLVDGGDDAGAEPPLDLLLRDGEHVVGPREVGCSGDSSSGAFPSSTQVSTTARGRSWEMCAFMPASANWIGSVWSRARPSNRGPTRH